MNRFIIVLFFLLFSPLSQAEKFFDKFSAEKVSPHVYVVHGPLQMPNPDNKGFMNNPAFIVADKSVVVIDPGSSRDTALMLMREIKKITSNPVSHIFNTHIHGDHWLGNDAIKEAYPDVVILADARMIKKAKAGEAEQWVKLLEKLTSGATAGTKIVYPNQSVKDGEILQLAGLKFKVHSVGMAHSDTDIMVELLEDSIMFMGDNLGYKRIMRMDDGSFRDSIAACERAINLKLKHYVPGHGKTGGVNIVELQREYFNTLYTLAAKYYEQGLEAYEMKPKIVAALAKFKTWPGFEEGIGKQISLAVLEVEKAEFE